MRQAITETPTLIANLVAGTRYTLQNKSQHVLHIEAATAAPTHPGSSFDLRAFDFGVIRKTGTDEIYIWTEEADPSGAVVYDEVA